MILLPPGFDYEQIFVDLIALMTPFIGLAFMGFAASLIVFALVKARQASK